MRSQARAFQPARPLACLAFVGAMALLFWAGVLWMVRDLLQVLPRLMG